VWTGLWACHIWDTSVQGRVTWLRGSQGGVLQGELQDPLAAAACQLPVGQGLT
jgi:hypothetical protein